MKLISNNNNNNKNYYNNVVVNDLSPIIWCSSFVSSQCLIMSSLSFIEFQSCNNWNIFPIIDYRCLILLSCIYINFDHLKESTTITSYCGG